MDYKMPNSSYFIGVTKGYQRKVIVVPTEDTQHKKITLPNAKKLVREELKTKGWEGWKIEDSFKITCKVKGNFLIIK